MDELKVLFCPFYPAVPYQQRLCDALAEHQVVVRGVPSLGIERPTFADELDSWRPDVLHLHWLHPWFLEPGLVATLARSRAFLAQLKTARRQHAGLVWTAHNLVNHDQVHPRIDAAVTRRVAGSVDAIIAHGEGAREALVEFCGESIRERVHIIPMGHAIDDYENDLGPGQARDELGIGAEQTAFLFLGRIRGYKGVFDLLEAFESSALAPRAVLHIAGKTSGDRLRIRLKKRCGRTAGVQLHYGFVPDERMQVFLNGADFVVLPYREILSSAAALLAASFGRAHIAPDLPCFREVLSADGGIWYRADDPRALEQALREAHERRGEATDMGQKNLEQVRCWSWADAARRTASLYRRILA